jgi:putative restriction endonuclease
MLEKYIQMFARHRTDRGRNRYPEITYHRAPHKPFLLLSFMDLMAQGRITKNLIEPSCELVDTFNTYWNAIMPPGLKTGAEFPLPLTTSLVRSMKRGYHREQWPSG